MSEASHMGRSSQQGDEYRRLILFLSPTIYKMTPWIRFSVSRVVPYQRELWGSAMALCCRLTIQARVSAHQDKQFWGAL